MYGENFSVTRVKWPILVGKNKSFAPCATMRHGVESPGSTWPPDSSEDWPGTFRPRTQMTGQFYNRISETWSLQNGGAWLTSVVFKL